MSNYIREGLGITDDELVSLREQLLEPENDDWEFILFFEYGCFLMIAWLHRKYLYEINNEK